MRERIRRRARALLDRGALEREMDDEIRFHIEMEVDDLVRGIAPAPAPRYPPAMQLPTHRRTTARTPAEVDVERASQTDAAERIARFAKGVGIYVVLGAVFVAAVVITALYGDHPTVERFGPNLATEVLGIIITLAFVQRLLERQERARKLRAAVGALRKARGALTGLLVAWAELVKASLDARRTEFPRTVHQLFAPYYTEEIARLDPTRGAWLDEAARRVEAARRTLQQVIDTYGATLDADYLEALAEVVDDPFIDLVLSLADRPGLGAEEWRLRVNRSRGHLAAHFVRLTYATRLHNQLAREAARFRSRHLAPTAQLLSLQLESDRDLTLDTDLPAGWWSEPPAMGSLRASG